MENGGREARWRSLSFGGFGDWYPVVVTVESCECLGWKFRR